MKRRTSSSIPELPAPPRRKRGLSEEDRALWESVAKQVKPLRKRHRVEAAGRVGGSRNRMRRQNRLLRRSTPRRRESLLRSKPEPPPLAPIGRRERSHLSRGRKEIDARLDLHGMTQTQGASRAVRFPAARPP